MKRLFLHLPAIVIGLLAGWLISTRISPRETAPPTAAAAVVIAKPVLPAANAADFAKLVEARAPRPAPEAAQKLLLFGDSRKLAHSPFRAGLESEILRSIYPTDQVGENELLDVSPEGSPGAEEMLGRVARVRPAYALAVVGRLLSQGRKSAQEAAALRRRVFREWLRSDPKAALAEATSNGVSQNLAISGNTRGQHIQALMEEWSRLDPAAASAALATLPESGAGYTRKDFAEILFNGWHEKDPAAARQWAQSQTDPALRESLKTLADELTATDPAAKAAVLLAAPQRDANNLASALGEWLTGDPSAALAKISTIPANDKFWANDAADAAQRWAMNTQDGMTPDQFLETIRTVPAGPQREAFLKGLAGYGSSNDIPFAVRMVAEMGEGRPRDEATGMLTELWMRKDPVKTSEWLATLPADSASRHNGVARFAENLAPDDPERAAVWADSLPDSYWQKEGVVKTVLEKWRAKDPAAAEAWAGGK